MSGGRGRRIVVALAAVAAVALTARLGVWQVDRGAQKRALQAAIEQRGQEPPLAVAQLARTADEAPAQHHRRATLQGRWIGARTVFLDNRQMHGRPGFFVVTPLQLADGSAVAVQRGWIPRDAQDRTRLPAVPTPAGDVVVDGRIAPPPARLYEFQQPGTERIRQNLDLDAYARETGLALRPWSLVQTGAPSEGLERDWPEPAVDVARHQGYAFQWFALSALVAGLYVWFQLVRPRWPGRRRAG